MSVRRVLTIAVLLAGAAAPAHAAGPPDRRADALVDRMTLDEKIQLVHGVTLCFIPIGEFPGSERSLRGDGFVPGIPRLGIPDINYVGAGAGVTNCGARENGRSTVLPSPLARASSWSPALAYGAGALLGTEARAQGFTTLLGGVSDLIREPRWGRAFETLGEDPVLNGTLVAAEVRGVQSRKVVATLKHYAVNNQETGRETHTVEVDERSLRELHLLPYEIAVPASRVGNVMCAYNRVNGVYACENDTLLDRILKGELGFEGQVQSDWGATHSTVPAALAGLDEEQFTSEFFGDALKAAVQRGQVPMTRLDDMVRRKLRSLIAVGVLDDPPPSPGPVDAARGVQAAERIAEQSLVLLKNDGEALPLERSLRSIAVIGSHADMGVLSGGGSAQVSPIGGPAVPPECDPETPGGGPCPVWVPSSPLQAIRAAAPRAGVRYADGDDDAPALAARSDVAIVFAHEWRSEFEDRTDLALPDGQEALIERVAAANPNTIVVLETGGPVTMPWAGRVRAVLEAWYPGSGGGPAIARTLFGDVNPAGKLTVTFPRRLDDLPTGPAPPSDGDAIPYAEGMLVGYRWYDAKRIAPQFPFGHGLSYTSYRYSDLRVKRRRVSFAVANTGRRAGTEIAQVYIGLPRQAGEPPKRLAGWIRTELRPGQTRRVSVCINPARLAVWDRGWKIRPGDYDVYVGASSRDIRLRGKLRPGKARRAIYRDADGNEIGCGGAVD